MASPDLATLITQSRGDGWATATDVSRFHFTSMQWDARQLALEPVPNRQGEAERSLLTPVTQAAAHRSSMSAEVGLGQQPLHTDGAHHKRVPDIVLLWSEDVNSTGTRVWSPWTSINDCDGSGMFLMRSGPDTWLAPAIEDGWRLRYDPVCMTPADGMAIELAQRLQSPSESEVETIYWDAPGKLLVLHNRCVLHGRDAVADGDDGRILRRLALRRVDQ